MEEDFGYIPFPVVNALDWLASFLNKIGGMTYYSTLNKMNLSGVQELSTLQPYELINQGISSQDAISIIEEAGIVYVASFDTSGAGTRESIIDSNAYKQELLAGNVVTNEEGLFSYDSPLNNNLISGYSVAENVGVNNFTLDRAAFD